MYMGEGTAYRRSKTLRCLFKVRTVYGHNSGESLEWAPKVQRCFNKRPYLSGQWTEQSLCDGAIAYHMSLTFYRSIIFVLRFFICL